ncbi:MAG TPA: flagellar basal body L-ring protein FlgH [Candidatus Binataceae bacterium]|nr:flagellar basal body L-ring protein FlgH [Candidatus Binataceae bacterium]
MKRVRLRMLMLKLPLLLLLAATLNGCVALPFLPMIAHAVPRMLFPDLDPANQAPKAAQQAPPPPDTQIATAVAAPITAPGDTGVNIDQVDRVAFAPDAAGSIPMRVMADDLVADVKARSVGDVLTVNVTEAVASESKAGTTLSNQRAISAGLPNFFGVAENFAAKNPSFNLASLVNGTSTNSTTGAGDLTAADTFTATVSAVVTAVNPSGTLSIRGERSLQVNGEDDTIHLSGVVRPQDIDSSDAIASAQVADLNLSISGEGQSRDKQGDGLATRMFDRLWLF